MKVNLTSASLFYGKTSRGLLIILAALLLSVPAYSQAYTPAEEVGDLSQVQWKSTAELLPSIAAEQTKMGVALSPASLAPDEKALYKAYQRLLTYLQNDLQGGKPVDTAILSSYEKVLTDAVADPELKNMPSGQLATYVPGLVEVLSEPVKPATAN